MNRQNSTAHKHIKKTLTIEQSNIICNEIKHDTIIEKREDLSFSFNDIEELVVTEKKVTLNVDGANFGFDSLYTFTEKTANKPKNDNLYNIDEIHINMPKY